MMTLTKRDMVVAVGIFFGFFSLYLFTAGPWVVPYRDTGEMSTLLATLGVAHPPGYPLYTLLGHLFVGFPLGNLAYRANIFSGLAGAASLVLLFVLFRTWMPSLPSLAGCAFLGLAHPFWELSVVSEMYSLGMLMLIMLLLSATRWEHTALLPFVMGLALGVRMDLLLLVPIFVIWRLRNRTPTNWPLFAGLFFLGMTIFLYLPIRSRTDPILDWGNPETLSGLFASLSRKSYGGTLDLVSTSYKKGENFGINLTLYLKHLWTGFGLGALLALAGLISAVRRRWKPGLLFGVLFVMMGPVFLFLANMPPNPHSIAIVEAAYLPADLMVAVFAAFGLSALMEFGPAIRLVVFGVTLVGLWFSAAYGYVRNEKRDVWYGRDYVANVLRSLPPKAVGIFHGDVQLFSLWHAQAVDRKRQDVGLIATGLSASEWYWDMTRRWGVNMALAISLKTPEGWPQLSKASGRPIRLGYDVEIPGPPVPISGAGFLAALGQDPWMGPVQSVDLFPSVLLQRGHYRYGETPDFFSTDLIGNQARALEQQGLVLLFKNKYPEAMPYFIRSAMMDPTFSKPVADLGYLFFVSNRLPDARKAYGEAVRRGHLQLDLAARYKALPDTYAFVAKELSGSYVSLGGTEEKMGDKESARQSYLHAVQLDPLNAQAHYNLAVSYWGTDWDRVIEHMSEAVRINPSNRDAQRYLAAAVAKRGHQ